MTYFGGISEQEELMESRQIDKDIYVISSYWGDYIFAPFKGLAAKYSGIAKKWGVKAISYQKDILAKPTPLSKPCSVTFDLSHSCQLGCRYCSIKNDSSSLRMTKEDAKSCIDTIVSNALSLGYPKIGALFLGKGEPTTNWETLQYSLEYLAREAKKHNLRVNRCLTTNGILSERKLEFLSNNTEVIVLSWDGTEDLQNHNRPFKSGKGSFSFVHRSAEYLCRNNKRYHIRPTLTEGTLQHVPEITELFVRYRPERLLFQPMYSVGRGEGMPEVSAIEFCEAFFSALPIATKHGVRLEFPGNHSIRAQFCSAYNGIGFAVSADGYVSACDCIYNDKERWGNHFVYGHVKDSNILIDQSKRQDLVTIIPERIDSCRDCFAFYFCKGHCINNHINNVGKFTPLSKRNNVGCKINRIIMLFKIIYQVERRLPNGIHQEYQSMAAWL